jgi:predicted short-subunit dehydrogenase-like oxidoreductase (DUF2520 family)
MNITLIGAGHLATQLGQALHEKGHSFLQVYSRTISSAESLAEKLGSEAATIPERIRDGADLYICALKDDAIDEVLSHVHFGHGLYVHTAGSLPMSVLEKYTPNHGVLYPLQTFSKSRKIDFSVIPVFIETALPESQSVLMELASSLSDNVRVLSSEKRIYLHLSAVFANNFVNHLYFIAGDLLKEHDIDFKDLLPLIDETARKVHYLDPSEAQTGPAIRFDKGIIGKHLKMLEAHPGWANLYEEMSIDIYKNAKK